MFKRIAIAILVMACSTSVWARSQYFGYAQKGGQTVSSAGFVSRTFVQRSFPGATVAVYSPGTTTLLTIYSDSGGTPLANPLTASTSDASFTFWSDTGLFDLTFTGTGITTTCGGAGQVSCAGTFTWSNQTFNSGTSAANVTITDYGVGPTGELIKAGTGTAPNYSNTAQGSIFIGLNVGNLNTTGDNNVCVGPFACTKIATVNNITAFGTQALRNLTTGGNNAAFGSAAGLAMTTGSDNTLMGIGTGQALTTGVQNTAMGQALTDETTGSSNTAIGYLSQSETNGGDDNTSYGVESLFGGIHGNQVVDGTFPNSTNWNVGANWTIASNKATKSVNGTDPLIAEANGTTPYIDYAVGNSYFISYTVSDYTAGQVVVSFGGVSDVARSSNGTFTWTAVPTTIGTSLLAADTLQFTPDNAARLSISAVSLTGINNSNIVGNTAVGVGAGYHTSNTFGKGVYNSFFGIHAGRQHGLGSYSTLVGYYSGKMNGTGDYVTGLGANSCTQGLTNSNTLCLGSWAGYNNVTGNMIFMDTLQRANAATEVTNSPLVGVVNAAPTVSNQTLRVNAGLLMGFDGAANTPAIARASDATDGFYFFANGWGYSRTATSAIKHDISGLSAERTVTWPDASISVARTDAAQTFAGTQNFSGSIQFNGSALLSTGGANIIEQFNGANDQTFRIYGNVSTSRYLSLAATDTVNTIGYAAGVTRNDYQGTSTNDSSAAGMIGEFITSTVAVGSAVALTTATPANITSVSLTAGDWDCSAQVVHNAAAGTSITLLQIGISVVSATLPTQAGGSGIGTDPLAIWRQAAAVPGGALTTNIAPVRVSLAGTTTVYLVANDTFTVSTMSGYGTLRCRRMR